jgi:membrane-associated HD superfamily phosphohydrolase
MDGQLDECNLTLKDLSVIENSFNRILLGIYHQRIDYPAGKKSPSDTSGGGKKPIASA